jgi:hypothetical protein
MAAAKAMSASTRNSARSSAEYAGVHRAQDALLDRVITVELGHYDRDTEIGITMSRSGVNQRVATRIVDLVRLCRIEGRTPHYPTIRACIAIARVLSHRGADAAITDPIFLWACCDILGPALRREGATSAVSTDQIAVLIERVCHETPPMDEGTNQMYPRTAKRRSQS